MRGIGTDIIEINRIATMKNKARFVEKLLSPSELEQFKSYINEKRQNEFLAGRWAVKEALYKALGVYCDGKTYQDFSVLNDEAGKPYLAIPILSNVHISLSHCEQYAIAFVVVE